MAQPLDRSAATARRLALADPPYPPRLCTKGYLRPRASRWYGDTFVATSDRPADVHPDAVEWDDPATHRALLERLMDEYDGWAIATVPDGLEAYAPLPAGARIMAWFKKVAQPGGHRIHSLWEPVIVLPPVGRRDNRGRGCVPDVLIATAPRVGFIGAKPPEWVAWVLDALGYEEGDEVDDLFPGSGAVSAAIAQTRLAV